MRLAIASGKGGTGKTTVATSLAWLAGPDAWYVDCDVEAPNGHLFLRPEIERRRGVFVRTPRWKDAVCSFCGRCSDVCRFHGIAVLPKAVMVFPELCHGCGGCVLACPTGALRMSSRKIGTLEQGRAGAVGFIHGRLDVGEAKSPPLIAAVRKRAPDEGMVLIDAPPGVSCPALAAVRGVDACLLVAEPTPFGAHDLRLAARMAKAAGLPCAVVVNRAQEGDRSIEELCAREGMPVLARIPRDRRVAEAYSQGRVIVDALPELRPLFVRLWEAILAWAGPRRPQAAAADNDRPVAAQPS